MLLPKDSVFEQYLDPFPDDKPITSESTIKTELNKIEKPSISLFSKTFDTAVESAVTQLTTAIAEKDEDKIKTYQWSLPIRLSNNLYGEWLLGWQTGSKRADKEIQQASNLPLQFSQPEPEPAIIRNKPAEDAIKARTNTLARDVSDGEWKDIRKIILESIQPQSATESPISRRELLKRINQKLGDRKKRFKDRAENIARTELTFAYNAGRLDSYVRSPLVEGVRFSTILDDRRCKICESRQGIIVSLDDVEGLAEMAIPVHPRCRCVWSPVLKTDFSDLAAQPKRQRKNRKLIPGKGWLAGAILAAILIPEELFFVGAVAFGIKKIIQKAGSLSAARLFIASKINKVHQNPTKKAPYASTLIQTNRIPPVMVAPGIDLRNISREQLRSLIPNITDAQINQILLKSKGQSKIKSLQDLSKILDKIQYRQLRAIARKNNLLNLLHPKNNLSSSAIWVNSGGIISKSKSKAIFDLIKNTEFNSLDDLLKALRSRGVDATKLNNYAVELFDRDNRVI